MEILVLSNHPAQVGRVAQKLKESDKQNRIVISQLASASNETPDAIITIVAEDEAIESVTAIKESHLQGPLLVACDPCSEDLKKALLAMGAYGVVAPGDITQEFLTDWKNKISPGRAQPEDLGNGWGLVVDMLPVPIVLCTEDGVITYINGKAESVIGTTRSNLLQTNIVKWIPNISREKLTQEESKLHDVMTLLRLERDSIPITIQKSVLPGALLQYCLVLIDESDNESRRSRINYLNEHDPLTGTLNSTTFDNRLSTMLVQAKRSKHKIAVMLISIDHLRLINSTAGRTSGDLLISGVAENLKATVREADLIGRFNGADFAIALHMPGTDDDINAKAKEFLRAAAGQVHTPLEGSLQTTASIGIALFPEDGISAQDLLLEAELAAGIASGEGGNVFKFKSTSRTGKLA